jgi:hypothetical protein
MGFLDKLFGGGKGGAGIETADAVEQMVVLYDNPDVKADGGISVTSRQATEIRELGKRLHKAGGKARMEEARDQLRARLPWAANNLETIWSGTKEWQG